MGSRCTLLRTKLGVASLRNFMHGARVAVLASAVARMRCRAACDHSREAGRLSQELSEAKKALAGACAESSTTAMQISVLREQLRHAQTELEELRQKDADRTKKHEKEFDSLMKAITGDNVLAFSPA